MQRDSLKRRVRVAPGIYRQDGALFANYREPGTGRSQFTKLDAKTIREATPGSATRSSVRFAKDAAHDAPRSP
jgi:hypothetical protein